MPASLPISPNKGIRTRVMLVAALVLAIAGVIGASLWIVRDRVQLQVSRNLSADLAHSVRTFENVQRQRRAALDQENSLLADLPSLKALMTTNDKRTIADGALEFWKVSGNDLFALANNQGKVVVVYTQGASATENSSGDLQALLLDPQKHYLLSAGRLFEFSVRPLYFGSEANGTLLGYVISGYAIDRNFVAEISQTSAAEAFLAGDRVVASTLSPTRERDLIRQRNIFGLPSKSPVKIALGGEHFLAISQDLSQGASVPLHLVMLKSFEEADQATREIDRLVSLVGIFALVMGSVWMWVLSGMITRPLETLAKSVRAFGTGDQSYSLPENGTREVRELSAAFARMRSEIYKTNRALLESERLATIGRMASSISHDLRHYLAAVYANAEFLSSSTLADNERAELLADIRQAVHGTTELIDSLLIFSRTGIILQRTDTAVATIVDKAVALVRAHPDVDGVTLQIQCSDPLSTVTSLDEKKMERAIYNLLLNACQSARRNSSLRDVKIQVATTSSMIAVTITDTGPGVPVQIQNSLFEPFVSEGKHSGTGLGLTLAHWIAEEHGGSVRLVRSRPGETVFELVLPRTLPQQEEHSSGLASGKARFDEVYDDE